VIKKFILFLIILSLAIPTALATSPPLVEQLCVEKVNVNVPYFLFLDGVNYAHSSYKDDSRPGCYPLQYFFERPSQIYYTENVSRIRVILNDVELINTELAPLKTTAILPFGPDVKKNVTVFMCPTVKNCPLSLNFPHNLEDFDNSTLKIYMDDTLVREYILGYYPGDKESGIKSAPYFPYIYFLILIIVILLFYFFRKKIRV
jgi:hypothetical protein